MCYKNDNILDMLVCIKCIAKIFNNFIFFLFHFLAVLGLYCCSGFFLVAEEELQWLLIAVASLVVEHRL